MFGALGNRILDGLDLAVELATLGEYRLDGPAAHGAGAERCDRRPGPAFDWPAPCGGPSRRRQGALAALPR
jgi:hypothetical protein